MESGGRSSRVTAAPTDIAFRIMHRRHTPRTAALRAALRVAVALAFALAAGCGRPAEPDAAMLTQWVRTWYGAVRVERLSPPVASRVLAYATTALYAGMVAANPELPPVAGKVNGLDSLPRADRPRDHDMTITAVEAERVVMDSLLAGSLPTTRSSVARLADSLVDARVEAGVSTRTRERSAALGRAVGLAIVAWSRRDGFDATRGRPYVAPEGPALWKNDAPANTFATQNMSGTSEMVALDNPANQLRPGAASDRGLILSRPKSAATRDLPAVNMSGAAEPYWRENRPFVLARWDECQAAPHPPYSTDSASEFYAAAKRVHDVRATLTDEQRTIALYWADNGGESGTPVGHWLSIASLIIREQRIPGPAAARIAMATALAQADAFIAAFGYKYTINLIRPRMYIRRVIDPKWEPLIPTPPFPEYPSAHSTQSAAAAVTLTSFVGPAAFDDSTSISIGHTVRHFEDPRAAANEAGISRIYGGIHYPFGDLNGRALGACIGEKVIARFPATPIR